MASPCNLPADTGAARDPSPQGSTRAAPSRATCGRRNRKRRREPLFHVKQQWLSWTMLIQLMISIWLVGAVALQPAVDANGNPARPLPAAQVR